MPYYPEDQSDKNLDKIRQNNVCGDCGRNVWVHFDFEDKRKYIACPTPGHEGLSREYKPRRVDYRSNIRRETEVEQQYGREASTKLATIPKQGQLTQSQAMHVLKLVYPDAPEDEIVRCAILCRDFGLHPLMKEVFLIPFKKKDSQGKVIGEDYATVLGINATRKLMAQRGTYSYTDDTPRLMTEAEQKRIFGEVDTVNIVAITKLKTKDGLEAPGYGRWPNNKEPKGVDKGNTKANMAFIRSERNAFGRLSPDALPPDVEVIDEAYTELPDTSRVLIKETGEIIEGEVVKEKAPAPAHAPAREEHWCKEHETPFFKKGKMKWYAHQLDDGGWCNEIKKKETQPKPVEPAPMPVEETVQEEPQEQSDFPKTTDDLKQVMDAHGWKMTDIGPLMRKEKGWDISDLNDLTLDQIIELMAHIRANPKP